ncbi:MAG: hypothetical protein KGI91_03150 [Burkholderiales bacterium]|nr:hypothetical protein [Burkholderiales bacterium]
MNQTESQARPIGQVEALALLTTLLMQAHRQASDIERRAHFARVVTLVASLVTMGLITVLFILQSHAWLVATVSASGCALIALITFEELQNHRADNAGACLSLQADACKEINAVCTSQEFDAEAFSRRYLVLLSSIVRSEA